MKSSDVTDRYALEPVLTADGKPWTQRCYLCGKVVNFIKDHSQSWVRVEKLVRHSKCTPPPLR